MGSNKLEAQPNTHHGQIHAKQTQRFV